MTTTWIALASVCHIYSTGQKFGHPYSFTFCSLFFYIVEQYGRHQTYEITHMAHTVYVIM